MKSPNQNTSRAANWRFSTLVAAAALLGGAASARHVIEVQPYGEPSESYVGGPGSLGLYFTQIDGSQPALRLEGGTPGELAFVVFSTELGDTELPGGGRLLVGPIASTVTGIFDAQGTFLHLLNEARFESTHNELFAQGMQPAHRFSGAELSSGLQLTRVEEPITPTEGTPQLPEKILVEEFGGLLRSGHLEAGLDLALNSKDDAVALELKGKIEVPVFPGVTVGGKAALKAGVKRGEDSQGTVVYDLAIASDVAASAGVGVGAAGAGASAGGGVEVIWRYASTHEVARAIRSMVILQAVGPRLELASMALNTQVARIDRAIAAARRAAGRARSAFRSRMPWRNNALVRKLQRRQDQLRAKRHQVADRARRTLERLIGWVATEKIFLIHHLNGYEVRQTTAIDASVGASIGPNLGAKLEAEIEQQFGMRVEFVPESDAMFYENKTTYTRSIKAEAGWGYGVAAAGKRVIEMSQKIQVGTDGLQLSQSGTTVKVTLDGELAGVLGAFATARFGVGGEVVLELRLRDLLGYSADAISILLGDDTQKAAELLRALPIVFHVRGRYEAGIGVGFDVDIDGAFKFGLDASAKMTDWGKYEGGSDTNRLIDMLNEGPMSNNDSQTTTLQQVRDEVTRIMR